MEENPFKAPRSEIQSRKKAERLKPAINRELSELFNSEWTLRKVVAFSLIIACVMLPFFVQTPGAILWMGPLAGLCSGIVFAPKYWREAIIPGLFSGFTVTVLSALYFSFRSDAMRIEFIIPCLGVIPGFMVYRRLVRRRIRRKYENYKAL